MGLAALATAQFMVVLDSSIVNVALPSIRHGLGLSAAQLSWVVDGYLVAFGGLLLLGGRLSDVLRRRLVFLGGMALFVMGSAACALAPDGDVLVIARVVQGAGGAVLAPAALSIVMRLFPDGDDRSFALGIWGGVSGAGGIAGVLLGGILTETLGWPWIFLINLPIGVAAGVVVLRSVPGFPATPGSFDLAGAVTITVSMAALAFGLVSGSEAGWSAPRTAGALVLGAVALAAFAAAERRARRPLIPLSVFRRGPLVTANAIMLAIGAVMVGLFYFLPQYQQLTLGMSPIQTSLAQVPIAVTISGAGLLAPRIARRIGQRAGLTGGLTLLTAGLLWLAPAGPHASFAAALLGPFLLIGTGLGVTFVYITSLAVAGAAPGEAGLVSGLVNATRQQGGALGLAALVAVAAGTATHGAHGAHGALLTANFTAAFAGAGALAAIALLLSLAPALRPDRSTHRLTASTAESITEEEMT